MTPNKRDLKAYVRFDGTGRIVPSSLILRKRKPKVGKWVEIPAYECCNFEPVPLSYSLELFYQRINTCYSQVTDLIPNINYFYDEDDAGGDNQNYIDDGGCDMWDGGNAFNTNLTQLYADAKEGNVDFSLSIPYTHTKAAFEACPTPYNPTPMDGVAAPGDSYFGTGSLYFTNLYPGLFILAASGLNINQFSITGDLGTDGNAYDATLIAPTNYIGWTAFCKTNTDVDPYPSGDPTVNHIILVKGDITGITHEFNNTGDYDDDALLNMNVTNTDIIVAVFSTLGGTAVTKKQLTAIANKILEVAGDETCVPMPSDVRLKENIVPTGNFIGELPEYKWEWNATAKGLKLDHHPTTGVLAQEVLEKKPEAVIFDENIGYFRVNYNKINNNGK